MGERERKKVFEKYPFLSFTCLWNGSGKWHKKRLSKVRRLAAKRELRGLHVRNSLVGIESEVNWRGW